MRTGDWEFAAFLGDGSRKPNVNFERCRECHLQAERFDFTFSVFPNLDAMKR
ncbi:MAG: cytochrome P460 family protein [Geminicoccaceae bacterium]